MGGNSFTVVKEDQYIGGLMGWDGMGWDGTGR